MKLKSNGAFTLIELLVALSIVSIISMSFFSLLNSSIKVNSKNETDINSLNIAQSEIEKLRKQIKSTDIDNLYIEVEKEKYMYINKNGDENISWVNSDNDINIQYIRISDSGKYSNYIGIDDNGITNNSIIRYTVSKNTDDYLVNLSIEREIIGSKYLYKLKIKINNENFKLSNKYTTLYSEILSK